MPAPSQGKNPLLSKDDVVRLITERTVEVRAEVIDKITHQYDDGSFSETEIQLAEQIIRFLTHDAEIMVRKIISNNLKKNVHLPHDIAIKLAKDISDEVAVPMLEASSVLNDDDLIEIIKETDKTSKGLAIAQRNGVSSDVSNALVDQKNEKVVEELLKNQSANLETGSLEKIIDQFPNSIEISESLISRRSIPTSIKEKLLHSVSENIRSYLLKNYSLNSENIDEVVERSREYAILSILGQNPDELDSKGLAEHLFMSDKLTPSMLITAISLNYWDFFESAISKMAKIPCANAKKLIEDVNGLGFESLYRKAGLPSSMQQAITALIASAIELNRESTPPFTQGDSRFCNRLVEKVLADHQEEEVENLPYLVNLITRMVSAGGR